jgi:hypothetical protein
MAEANKPTAKDENKYPNLPSNFMRGTPGGQIASLYKARDNAAKLADFRKAVAAGDIKIAQVTPQQKKKLDQMRIEIPGVKVAVSRTSAAS